MRMIYFFMFGLTPLCLSFFVRLFCFVNNRPVNMVLILRKIVVVVVQ